MQAIVTTIKLIERIPTLNIALVVAPEPSVGAELGEAEGALEGDADGAAETVGETVG